MYTTLPSVLGPSILPRGAFNCCWTSLPLFCNRLASSKGLVCQREPREVQAHPAPTRISSVGISSYLPLYQIAINFDHEALTFSRVDCLQKTKTTSEEKQHCRHVPPTHFLSNVAADGSCQWTSSVNSQKWSASFLGGARACGSLRAPSLAGCIPLPPPFIWFVACPAVQLRCRQCVAMLLETTTVQVAPVALRRVGAVAKNRETSWLLLLLLIAGSAGAEPNTETSDAEPSRVGVHVSGGMEQALASGKENAATALSVLESLLASLDPFLAEHGLPSASLVLGGVAVGVLFLLFLGQVGIGGGSGGGASKKRKGVVLFLGPCGSGKTAMCYRLSHGGGSAASIVSTATSMEACRYPCHPGSPGRPSSAAAASLVDYPGHERLRGGVGQELRGADRVVFMLDGSCLAAQVAAGAELLYDVLTDPSLEGCRGLMLALSKSDLKESKASRAKMLLQKELDKLRGTRGMLGTQGEEDDMPTAMALGRPGQPFSLEVDSPCEVVIAGCSVVKEGGMESVLEFVRASLH